MQTVSIFLSRLLACVSGGIACQGKALVASPRQNTASPHSLRGSAAQTSRKQSRQLRGLTKVMPAGLDYTCKSWGTFYLTKNSESEIKWNGLNSKRYFRKLGYIPRG